MLTRKLFIQTLAAAWLLAGWGAAQAQTTGGVSIAVTELSYEQTVRSHFAFVDANSHSQTQMNAGMAMTQSDGSVRAASGDLIQINRGEMHQFTGDIKGALIKSGQFKIIQGRPWTKQDTSTIVAGCIPPKCDGSPTTFSENVTLFDVIDRIKKGYYPGADYVLFGTVTNIEDRNEALPIQGSNAVNYSLSVSLVADFSLVNTKTYQVTAGFSAIGEGNDARLVNSAAAVVRPSASKALLEVSRSLGDDVARQILEQFPQAIANPAAGNRGTGNQPGKVTEFR